MFEFDGEQLEALNAMKAGENVFLTGEGGSGKSTVVKEFLKSRSNMDVAILAPTGIAALNINGMTIHRFFKLKIDDDYTKLKERYMRATGKPRILRKKSEQEVISLVNSIRVIVIDEIGMARSDILNAVDAICRGILNPSLPFGGLQVILTGDPYQLPPVVTDNDSHLFEPGDEWFFNSEAFLNGGFKKFTLKKSHRVDSSNPTAEAFKDALNAFRLGAPQDKHLELINSRVGIEPKETAINLVTTNKRAREINEAELDCLNGAETVYRAWKTGDARIHDFPVEYELKLKPGARVIFTINDSEDRWVNGSLGTVVFCDEKEIMVDIDGHGVEPVMKNVFEQKDWTSEREYFDEDDDDIPDLSLMKMVTVGEVIQFPLRLSWAITIHKSQGKTLDDGHVDVSSGVFAPGQPYVGFSRMRSLEGVTLEAPVKKEDFWACPHVEDFMRTFQ